MEKSNLSKAHTSDKLTCALIILTILNAKSRHFKLLMKFNINDYIFHVNR